MSHLTADGLLLDRLRGIVVPVEIRDPAGKVLGHYTPLLALEVAAMHEKASALFDLEEAKRALADEHGQGRPLTEILQSLRAREQRG